MVFTQLVCLLYKVKLKFASSAPMGGWAKSNLEPVKEVGFSNAGVQFWTGSDTPVATWTSSTSHSHPLRSQDQPPAPFPSSHHGAVFQLQLEIPQ